jgi:predicted RNA binding protein YcfA (HicA-like mRNA interferase family)
MPKVFKVLSGSEVVKMLVSFGFTIKTQRGSHIKLSYKISESEIIAMVPNHKTLKQGTMVSIYKKVLEIDGINLDVLNNIFKN